MNQLLLGIRRLMPAKAAVRLESDLSEAKHLVWLALPMTGAALVNMGMSITDTVMMGWMGPAALAAGAVVSDVQSIVFYFMAGILTIVSPMFARAVGARDPDAAGRTMRHGILVAGIVAVPAFIAVWHASDFVGLFGVDPELITLGRGYAHAIAFSIVPMLFVTLWRNMFDAIGRPRVYLTAIGLALPLNALANQVFMFGWGPVPAYGLTGAGIASAIVAIALISGMVVFGAINQRVRATFRAEVPLRIEWAMLVEIFRLGLPVGLFMIGEVGIFLLSTTVVSLFGVEALAAHAITLRLAGVIYAIPAGLSQAATVRVSHAIGAADHRQRVRAIGTARRVGIVAGGLIFLGLAGASSVLPALVLTGTNEAIAALVASLMVVLGLLNVAQGFVAPATAVLRAHKETKTPMYICLAGYWLIGMPVAYMGGFNLGNGVLGIWIGLAAGVAATAAMMNARLAWRLGGSA